METAWGQAICRGSAKEKAWGSAEDEGDAEWKELRGARDRPEAGTSRGERRSVAERDRLPRSGGAPGPVDGGGPKTGRPGPGVENQSQEEKEQG